MRRRRTLGEVLIDFTENGSSAQGNLMYEANPGGAPCNVLAMLQKFGHKTAIFLFTGIRVLRAEELREQILKDTRIFHFGTLSMTDEPVRSATRHAIETAKANGALLSFDPNIREPLWQSMEEAKRQTAYGMEVCDVLKISE
jgi:fructokinase